MSESGRIWSVDLREYMSVRRAYNVVRQSVASSERLTFEEFAILCRLDASEGPMNTSSIAEYQGALRPTMTHRTNHLAGLGLIERAPGERDRRNVVCSISDLGRERVRELCGLTRAKIRSGRSLSRTSPERIEKYVDAMGSFFCNAGDLVLLGLLASEKGELTVMQLVDALGLLQPTVSMSVSALVEEGMLARDASPRGGRGAAATLTPEGYAVARELEDGIARIVVRRGPRRARRSAVEGDAGTDGTASEA